MFITTQYHKILSLLLKTILDIFRHFGNLMAVDRTVEKTLCWKPTTIATIAMQKNALFHIFL